VVPLAENWWFWVVVAAALAGGFAFSGRYATFAAAARRAAVRRHLVELPEGKALRRTSAGFRAELSWLVFAAGAWVVLGPWTWGYDGARGAIETDVVTGALVIAIAFAAIVFPALWTLELVAGLWLVLAPWLVGYGDANGPVGLSDTLAGLVIFAISIAALSAAERALRSSPGSGEIGRLRRPGEPGDQGE
jgi:hypothetical protein